MMEEAEPRAGVELVEEEHLSVVRVGRLCRSSPLVWMLPWKQLLVSLSQGQNRKWNHSGADVTSCPGEVSAEVSVETEEGGRAGE